MKRWMMLFSGLILAGLLTGCSSIPGLSGEALEEARAQYGLYEARMKMETALDWADAVMQVEVLHDNALPESLRSEDGAVAVHVQQAICGSVADSEGVNDQGTAVLWREEDDPELVQGQWLILAVREKVLPGEETVLEYDASLTFYLHEEKYMISATEDNETALLNGHTLEGLTEQLWPLYHPGQNQFSRSLLDARQREELADASGFVRRADVPRMDYGRMREILRQCRKDEMHLDLMVVRQEGTLVLEEELYSGGGIRMQKLEDEETVFAEGTRLIIAGNEALYGVDEDDRLICLSPEAKTFTLTGITLLEFKKGLELIAP